MHLFCSYEIYPCDRASPQVFDLFFSSLITSTPRLRWHPHLRSSVRALAPSTCKPTTTTTLKRMGTLISACILCQDAAEFGWGFFFGFILILPSFSRSPPPCYWPQLTAGTNSLARFTQGSLFSEPRSGTDISDTDCLSYSKSVPEHSFTTVANTNL
jgi:hypothetical protein